MVADRHLDPCNRLDLRCSAESIISALFTQPFGWGVIWVWVRSLMYVEVGLIVMGIPSTRYVVA